MPIDILSGSPTLREDLDAGVPASEIARGWDADVARFRQIRAPFLIYQ